MIDQVIIRQTFPHTHFSRRQTSLVAANHSLEAPHCILHVDAMQRADDQFDFDPSASSSFFKQLGYVV